MIRHARALFAASILLVLCAPPASAAGPPTHPPRPDLSHPAQRACGVATDPLGYLYVSEQTPKAVKVFAPDGSEVTSFASTELPNNPCQIAVDSSGDVYVINSLRSQAIRYSPSAYPPTASTTYKLDKTLNGNGRLAFGGSGDVVSVAVNPANDEVYLAEDAGNEIQEFAKPSENYELEVENPETEEAVKSGPLTAASNNTAIQEALRSALCGSPTAGCLTVADVAATAEVAARWRVTFNGAATTPKTAATDIAAIKVIKAGGDETAFEMFDGAATDHVRRFQPNGSVVSKTIGSSIAGANYTGVDVYAKNGNVYLTDQAKGRAYVLNAAGDAILAEFDGSDSPAGAFSFGPLPDIAVDQANGHAYVVDIAVHEVLSEFDGAGNFVSEISHDPAFKDAGPSTVAVDGGATSPNKGVVYLTAFLTDPFQAEVFAYGPLTYAFPLKVTKSGQGDGKVLSTPLGIDCGATCEGEFEADGLVTLSPNPGFGSKFGEWSGCDAVTEAQECEVTMSGAREVSVRFDSRPVVTEQAAGQITSSSAQLSAKVNPKAKATTYYFEYIAEADWLGNGETFTGASKAPAGAAAIGSGTSSVAVGVKVEGLEPASAYRFRVLAESFCDAQEPEVACVAEGERDPKTDAEIGRSFATYAAPEVFEDCPNDEFRSGPSASLPDCRAYEQASPVEKNGTSIQGGSWSARAAEDGSAISFESSSGIPGGSGAQNIPTYLARRGSDGWATTGLLPPPSSGQVASVRGWTPDFNTVFNQSELLSQGSSFLSRSTTDGTGTEIFPHTLPNSKYSYLGVSEDGTKVAFEAEPDAGDPNVYAWNRGTGELHVAGVLPDGTTPPEGSQLGRGKGNAVGEYNGDKRAVGAEGSILFNDAGDGQLYLRLDPTGEDASTVHVSASAKTNGKGPGNRDAAGPQPASLMGANADHSMITFTSSEKLTNDANTGPEPDPPAIARAKASDGGEKNLGFIPAFAREIAIDPVEEYAYWSDPANGRIGRVKLDGTERDEDYISGLDEPLGIAVVNDPAAKYIFWTDRGSLDDVGKPQTNKGFIGRADIDGTDVDNKCIEDLTNPRSIAADPSFIYWTMPSTDSNDDGLGVLARASLACDSPVTSLIDGLASGDVAINGSHIYYSFYREGFDLGVIRRANLDGTDDKEAVVLGSADGVPGVALDTGSLYWTLPGTLQWVAPI